MRGKCPSCGWNWTQYRLYRRGEVRGRRTWIAVGWMCKRCDHLHKEDPFMYIGPRKYGIPSQEDEL